MSSVHRHRIVHSEDRGFSGPAPGAREQNPAAHGNIMQVDTCRCGAVRRTNINQCHLERGAWMPAETRGFARPTVD